ncbi:MAG: alanyl-tRNA editing protein [Clostridia bacterium]|nr:alanyl-tRNA editing protein [Clostridia bacterium]
MTNRLYYDDTYLTKFDATVVECIEKNGKYIVRLDQSAFYPTSGGQPYDTGTLNNASVTDVYVDSEGEVWHEIDAQLFAGEKVHGSIDWERRFDHMQQHAGEHMLANAAYRLIGGGTIGLHLGAEVSSIDMTLPEGRTRITAEELKSLEDDVNMRIQQNVPIRQWFPDSAELAELPLRKVPTVSEHVRIVQIGELEFCACGGTHPSSAGQIGLMKIVDARPSRGKLRISFVCGKRAFDLLRKSYDLLHTTADYLSTSVENVPSAIRSIDESCKQATRELNNLRRELLLSKADSFLSKAAVNENGVRIVAEFTDADINSGRELATYLTRQSRTVAIIGVEQTANYAYIVVRSDDVDMACGAALSAAAKRCGGKGGGKPDFAQGGGPVQMLDEIRNECSVSAK